MHPRTSSKRLLVAAAVLGSLSTGVRAADTGATAMQFLTACESGTSIDKKLCELYISGIVDGLMTSDAFKDKNHASICFPEEATADQAKLVIKKFMKEHPGDLHRPMAVVALMALFGVFPCDNKGR